MRYKQRTGTGAWHWKNIRPHDPRLRPIGQWLPANRNFYEDFRAWLLAASYGESALNLYSVVARLALSFLDQAYWMIESERDFDRVRAFIDEQYASPSTRECYHKGLDKFEEYWRWTQRRPRPAPAVHWSYYLDGLPAWLGDDLRRYLAHRRRSWRPAEVYAATLNVLGPLTRSLRWIAQRHSLDTPKDLTPARWFEYVDARLAAGLQPVTLNGQLGVLKEFLRFLAEEGQPITTRVLELGPLKALSHMPRDLPLDQLRLLLAEIERDATSAHTGVRRTAVMDRAWFLLMLHSGLRTGEVRRLALPAVDLKERRIRIEQSKGLKDRIVCLSLPTVQALEKYLKIRGPAGVAEETVFLYRHRPLTRSYLGLRLRTYGERCGVKATPHQLRHSCATLLLNAGAPILTVQTILGHQHVDTTLGYARLYDGTVAADYCQAMAQVEQRIAGDGDGNRPAPSVGELVALVDALRNGTLSENQQQLVQALRVGLLGLENTPSSPTDAPGHERRRRQSPCAVRAALSRAARELPTND